MFMDTGAYVYSAFQACDEQYTYINQFFCLLHSRNEIKFNVTSNCWETNQSIIDYWQKT